MSFRPCFPLALAVATAGITYAQPTAAQSFTAMVPMRDNVHLSTDVYLPTGQGPWPVLLYRTPYDKSSDSGDAQSFADIGIAAVAQDMRGRFASEGVDMVFLTDGDGQLKDGYDTMQWLVQQSWCDGHIGTTGGSARGIVQYMQSSANPPGLRVFSAVVATPNLYRDAMFFGGVFRHSLVTGWLEGQGSTHFLSEIAAHPFDDGFWDSGETHDQYQNVTAAGLHQGGWFDIFLQGNIDAFVGYQHQGGAGAAGKQKLIIGPWTHGGTYGVSQGEVTFPANATTPPYPSAFETMFNHYLDYGAAGITDTPDDVPNVQYYVMGDVDSLNAPGNVWRTADDWPPAAAPVRLHLHADRTLAESCPADDGSTSSYAFDPADPSPTICGQNLNLPAGPCDQRSIEQRADVLVFTTPVLAEPMEITGRVRAHLFVDIDQLDADLMVRMTDVYPDGRSMLIADGARRLAANDDNSGLTLVPPGQLLAAVVDLWSTSIIINAGHRLRISVTSGNHPRFAINQHNGQPWPTSAEGTGPTVTVRLHHSFESASYLELPDPSREATDFVTCGSGGSGGAGTGGGSGVGGAGAGVPGTAASPPAAGGDTDDSSSCGCRIIASRPLFAHQWLWLAPALALTLRRRRHR